MNCLKLLDLLNRYGIARTSLWRWRQEKNFPAPITPPNARPIWRIVDIEAWEQSNSFQGIDE